MAITMKGAGVDVATALALSFPFAVAFQFVITLVYTAMAGVSATATKALDNKQFKKFRLCCNLTVWVFLVLGFVIGFAGAMSAEGLEKVISLIPTWLNTGLSVAGAMLTGNWIRYDLKRNGKERADPFVLLGYCAIAYFKLPIIGVAILGTTVALWFISIQERKQIRYRNRRSGG